jgi:hypothetical protein
MKKCNNSWLAKERKSYKGNENDVKHNAYCKELSYDNKQGGKKRTVKLSVLSSMGHVQGKKPNSLSLAYAIPVSILQRNSSFVENNHPLLFIQLCIANDARLHISFVTSPCITFVKRDVKRLRRKMKSIIMAYVSC